MSSFDRDRHLVCTCCRGYECSVDLGCESWSQEEMLAHEKYRKSLASKSKGRGKSSTKSSKVPARLPLLLRPVPKLTWTLDLRHNMIKFLLILTLRWINCHLHC